MKKTTLFVKGMHCPSCEILIKDEFGSFSNVREVKPNFRTQKVEVCYTGHLNREELNSKIRQFGYQITEHTTSDGPVEPISKRLFDSGGIAIVLFVLYYLATELKLIPSYNVSSNLNYLTVFILGLVASTSTCMATSGALYLAVVQKLKPQNNVIPSEQNESRDLVDHNNSVASNLVPAVMFNLGRILSYAGFGFVVGLLGKGIASNIQLGSLLTVIVAIFMLAIGLDMTRIVSFQKLFAFNFTGGIFEKLEHRFIRNPKKTAFFLGAITYLLPCGFTQTVQLYALGLADPVKSSLMMLVFALGTVPALMAIGFASSFTKSKYYPLFSRVMGVVVFMIGVTYVSNFLSLYGVNIGIGGYTAKNSTASVVRDGVQVINMSVRGGGYYPSSFTIKKGVPVKWVINGENVFGCQGYLVVPKLGIQKTLEVGDNIIEFTPTETGVIGFSCAMGMYRGAFDVI